MDSQASNIDSQSASKQAADAPPFDLDQAGFKKSLTFVQEVRDRFQTSEPAKYTTFLSVLQETNVTPMESEQKWQATRAEKQAEARMKLEELFRGHEDLLEKLDAFLSPPSTPAEDQ
ncbi:hypothetical protein CNYM01_01163 [Colletotrichum nymphaeae SA-01]|uniref:Uncharacterized protein n=1 Tax=Colletotrichum nymphaeae SA-01 TaxID=1460502 RepID=A0A135TZ39_9PEZI|nr:hypothetical protein CNYM01_01163 [Colletotrichum nymphaeae SA-01]